MELDEILKNIEWNKKGLEASGDPLPEVSEDGTINISGQFSRLQDLDPEVGKEMAESASSSLGAAGIKKSDPMFGELMELELALRLTEADEVSPGWEDVIRNMRINDVKAQYGKSSPLMLQALGLRHGTTRPSKAPSKAAVLLEIMQNKRKRAAAAEERSYKRGRDIKSDKFKKANLLYKMMSGRKNPAEDALKREERDIAKSLSKQNDPIYGDLLDRRQLLALRDLLDKIRSRKGSATPALVRKIIEAKRAIQDKDASKIPHFRK